MKRLSVMAACALGILLILVPSAAFAQTPKPPKLAAGKPERAAVYINGGYQPGATDVQSTVNFSSNVETGSFSSTFRVKPPPALDAGARVRVWKYLSVGVAYTSFSTRGEATVTAQIPHPFFFRTPRAIDGTAPSERNETAVHVRAVVTSPPGRRLQFTGFAGPAFFSVRQTLIDKVNYSEAYPFDTATFTSAATRRVSTSKTGAGVGADVAYYFMKHLGVGLSASYAKVTFNLKAVDDSTVSISAGGAMVGIGARIRF